VADFNTLCEPNAAPRRRTGLFARFAANRRGVAAIEFAMVSIPLLGLICAIFETAFIFFTHQAFENAMANVARQVLLNSYASNTAPTASAFRSAYVCPALPSFIDCSRVAVNAQAFPPETSFSTISVNNAWYGGGYDASQVTLNLGLPGHIVVFQAFYPMPVYLSLLTATGQTGNGAANLYGRTSASILNNPNGSGFVHAIFSTIVFRNEPS
jgi:Flp pilus assembly protein TadG